MNHSPIAMDRLVRDLVAELRDANDKLHQGDPNTEHICLKCSERTIGPWCTNCHTDEFTTVFSPEIIRSVLSDRNALEQGLIEHVVNNTDTE